MAVDKVALLTKRVADLEKFAKQLNKWNIRVRDIIDAALPGPTDTPPKPPPPPPFK